MTNRYCNRAKKRVWIIDTITRYEGLLRTITEGTIKENNAPDQLI